MIKSNAMEVKNSINLLNNSMFISILLISITVNVVSAKFDVKRDVSFEMHCRSSNQSTKTTLNDIDLNVLDDKNFIFDSDQDIIGVKNCTWNWNPNRPTRIFIHGYYSNRETFMQYAEAYLNRDDYNFIAINWLRGAKTINYVKARHRVQKVGMATAKFIDYLVTLGLDLDHLILIGHSLGAHACGITGKNVKSGKVAAIVGLDPALPLFQLNHREHRLHYTDAKYVQIIHTSGGFLGVKNPIGHADFYPNFGCVQPACKSSIPCEYSQNTVLFHFTLYSKLIYKSFSYFLFSGRSNLLTSACS